MVVFNVVPVVYEILLFVALDVSKYKKIAQRLETKAR